MQAVGLKVLKNHVSEYVGERACGGACPQPRGQVIFLDTSVVIAEILSEDRSPPAAPSGKSPHGVDVSLDGF